MKQLILRNFQWYQTGLSVMSYTLVLAERIGGKVPKLGMLLIVVSWFPWCVKWASFRKLEEEKPHVKWNSLSYPWISQKMPYEHAMASNSKNIPIIKKKKQKWKRKKNLLELKVNKHE